MIPGERKQSDLNVKEKIIGTNQMPFSLIYATFDSLVGQFQFVVEIA